MAPAELWAALAVSRQGAMDLLRPLLDAGLVEKLGGKKSGRYVLKSAMNESETRAELIDPALRAAGWGVVVGRRVLREYHIAPAISALLRFSLGYSVPLRLFLGD